MAHDEDPEVLTEAPSSRTDGGRKKRRGHRSRDRRSRSGRNKSKEDTNAIAEISNRATSHQQQQPDKVLGVIVHYSDCLNLDVYLLHPSVKVLIVNLETGHFVDKQDREKQVTCYGDTNVRHIMPLMTQPFKFRDSGTLVPRWEELLIFNESFSYLSSSQQQTSSDGGRGGRAGTAGAAATQGREKLGLFFLVQDFVSMTRANNSNASEDKSGDGKGWHDVAWAFLKPFPSPGVANTETKLRLQLYKPHARKLPAADGGSAERPENEARVVWNWWANCKHVKYPSSLYVTVQAILPPKESRRGRGDGEVAEGGRDQPRAEVTVRDRYQTEDPADNGAVAKAMADAPKVPIWNRAPGTKCQIPNVEVARLEGAGRGVYCLRFSRCGRHLAMGCPSGDGASVIFVHDATAPSYPLLMKFGGHSGPIYELDWHDHRTLLSGSGDGTAQVWHLGRGNREVLEHPTFVYCARFHPNSLHVIVTGSYDRVIRVWKWNRNEERYSVQQELTEHEKGYITALEFDSEGHNLFSGDREGVVKIWEIFGDSVGNSGKSSLSSSALFFRLKRQLKLPELEGYSVESLRIHPGGRRLLVHSTSPVSSLVMVDLRQSGAVMQDYRLDKGGGGAMRRAGNCVSPCGDLVLAGGRGGAVTVWDTDTGTRRHVYEHPVGNYSLGSTHAVCFHPHDHVVVFGALPLSERSREGVGRRGPPAVVYKFIKEGDKGDTKGLKEE